VVGWNPAPTAPSSASVWTTLPWLRPSHACVPYTRVCPSSACRKEVYLRLRGDVTPYEIGVFNKTPFSSAPPLEVTEEELAESAATPEHLGDADDASLMAGK
jgi:hypothetical protein